ncbi:MAG: glycosyltransferase, partial [Actinomycetales bacterium]|nr:glycosyltransferase [Actinomycetales bacterium]
MIPVRNSWSRTRACLDSLRPLLAPGDQVVVIDNASNDDTTEQLGRYEWVERVTNSANRGFAVACN